MMGLSLSICSLGLILMILLVGCGSNASTVTPDSSTPTAATPRTVSQPGGATARPTTAPISSASDRGTPSMSTITPATEEATAMPKRPPVGSPEMDREALVALYNATDGPNWERNDNWLSSEPISEWSGVSTDNKGRGIELHLSHNNLSGEIPSELGNLANLETLGLEVNHLSGEIPPELGHLANLETLDLSENELSGEIPSEFGDLASLLSLDLSENKLIGEVPPGLGDLAKLRKLVLEGNQLSGCISDFLYDLGGGVSKCPTPATSDREALLALYNATDGPNWERNDNWLSSEPISEWWGVSTDRDGRVIRLDPTTQDWLDRDDRLNGEIPPQLGNLANLQVLRLDYSDLTGEIPPELGNLANLRELSIHGAEKLSGEIPPELGNLANLERLTLGVNHLRGEIPPELGNLVNLQELDLGVNSLHGEIPPELGNLANLEVLSLSHNVLSGEIPPELGNLANLGWLRLENNELSGEIPPELGDLANLHSLDLSYNQLSGEIPPSLGSAAKLTHLFLKGNEFSGCIPSSLQGQLYSDISHLGGLRFCR